MGRRHTCSFNIVSVFLGRSLNQNIHMGSCISKCIPRKHSQLEEFDHHRHHHDHDHVQDKLVISQARTNTTQASICAINIPFSNKVSPCPPSPSNSSTCSISSLACTTTSKYASSSSNTSSTSSTASSVICSSKDRSFSNEFLRSCYRENPHIVRINSLKESSCALSSLPAAKPRKLESSAKPVLATAAKPQQQPPTRLQKASNWSNTGANTPQKRVRSSTSPTPRRTKSFRKDQPAERPISTYSVQQGVRALQRSPSPSRRFSNTNNGDKLGGVVSSTHRSESSPSKRMNGYNMAHSSGSGCPRTENILRPSNPNSSCMGSSNRVVGRPCWRSRETLIQRIGSKIDDIAVGSPLAHPHDNINSIPMEDIDNPLIALDCFIFL